MSAATYKYSSSLTNANFMTEKLTKDQDQEFEKRVSTKAQVS